MTSLSSAGNWALAQIFLHQLLLIRICFFVMNKGTTTAAATTTTSFVKFFRSRWKFSFCTLNLNSKLNEVVLIICGLVIFDFATKKLSFLRCTPMFTIILGLSKYLIQSIKNIIRSVLFCLSKVRLERN